jgi:hypothetical protein
VVQQLDVLVLAPSVVSDLPWSAYRLFLGGLQLLPRGHPLGGRDNSRTQGKLLGIGVGDAPQTLIRIGTALEPSTDRMGHSTTRAALIYAR